MTVYEYIDNYGIYSFEEKELNEVDSIIFAMLSYADYTGIFDEKNKLTINEIGRIHIGIHKEKDKNIIAVREANKLIKYLKDVKRYKNCIISNYEYIGNKEIQFGAMTIEYMKNHLYVSFEGTDELMSSWKEDFVFGYKFPTESHKLAIKYLNKHFTFTTKKLIVGGHSKGGNLALVSSMYSNIFVRSKIKYVYSGDGPGLLDKQFNSKKYNKIKNKYIHIIPSYSFVGLFLRTSNNKVVKCKYKSILSHDALFWEVEDDHFIETELSPLSTEIQNELRNWFYRYNDEDKKQFINNLMGVFERAEVESLLDIKENNSKLLNIIYETKDIKGNDKTILLDFINVLIKAATNTKKEEFKDWINNIFKFNKE